nr:putative site-specific recombinase [uncultured bacterium]
MPTRVGTAWLPACDAQIDSAPGHQAKQSLAAISVRVSLGTLSENLCSEGAVATISKTPSATWKAVIRKHGWPAVIKTFRTKRDTADWTRRTEDEMVRGVYIDRAASERLAEGPLGEHRAARARPTLASVHGRHQGVKSMQMLRRYTHLRAEDLVRRLDQVGVR